MESENYLSANIDAAFPAKRPSPRSASHEWSAVSLPSPAPSMRSAHDRYAMTTLAGHPFPTPPASACDLKPSPASRPLLLPRAPDDVPPLATHPMTAPEPSSTPVSPESSPLRLADASWAKIRELTERRRVQGLAAKRNYRHRLEQESRRKMLEERGCASDTELDDSKPSVCWRAEIAVAHPKPISQFTRLAFLDLEDDFLLDGPYEYSRLTPPADEARPTARQLQRPNGGPETAANDIPFSGKLGHVLSLFSEDAVRVHGETAVLETEASLLVHPHELSESLSATSMSCDYDTTASEDEGRLGSRAERKRILLERLMHYFHSIIATCPPQTRAHAGSTQSCPRQAGDPVSSGNAGQPAGHGGSAGRHQDCRKRPPDDEDGDDEGDGSERKRPRRLEEAEEPPLRLACPYFKKNPRRYRLSRSCPGPGWSTVHRVKEHLYRCHRLPIHCLYCHEKFDSDKLLQVHLRADRPCLALDLPPLDGIDAIQEKLLRSRKKAHKEWTEAEKWRDAYRILFPHDDEATLPSPYYEYEQGAETDQATSPSEIARYEQYLRRELPNRVRQALETRIDEALNPIEERLRDQIVEIVRDSQLHLFERYKSSRTQALRDLPGMEAPPTLDESPAPGQHGVPGPSVHMLDDELQLYRPEPYFDQQFDDLNGDFFNFMQVQLSQDWDDSGYGSCSVAETLSPEKEKERAEQLS